MLPRSPAQPGWKSRALAPPGRHPRDVLSLTPGPGFSHQVDVAVVQASRGVGEVDVLENAQCLTRRARQHFCMYAFFIDGDEFARFDFAHEGRAETIQCARLRGDNPVLPDASQAQWAQPPWITCSI